MAIKKLERGRDGSYWCPTCGRQLHRIKGGAVRLINGRVDMENTKDRYECAACGVFYRELLSSGYFDEFSLDKKPIRSTGELQPMKILRDANGYAECPRCGSRMDFVEGQPVRIVDGKPDMDNVLDHFVCRECNSVYRRIVNTEYFQWFEK